MFEKILIANRGEIACRVIRTCRRLGIGTVAVYSDADADALHVRLADEAVLLGPPPAAESYLSVEKVVAAARSSGADAVHPGYGFLSENPALAEALGEAGIAFIGPSAAAIRLMGDKLASKRLAADAGVSIVPGHAEPVSDPSVARKLAADIGYPVMTKAAAGGGGKGMRIAYDGSELGDALKRAQSEARSSFGDDRVFLEKFVERPRHIEIQVLADQYGCVLHLGERECSIQRRHQKVIEEAPSPFLDAATREAMGEQAKALARAAGYHSAGTVEFIVDPDRRFYFLEMNTRLQVEHPVTELVTGLDLVEQMIRIAGGERLRIDQDDVRLSGWAIEARVYAENPSRGFVPSTGRLRRYIEPSGEGIRIDSGVIEGSEIPLFYDPMIAKVCAHGRDREEAAQRLRGALDGFYIRGLNHNVTFLGALINHELFRAGDLSTGFIAAAFGERFDPLGASDAQRQALAAMAVSLRLIEARRAASISGRLPGWNPRIPVQWVVHLAGEAIGVRAEPQDDHVLVSIGGRTLRVAVDWRPGRPVAHATIDGATAIVQVDPCPEGFRLTHGGTEVQALVRTREAAEFAARTPPRVPPDMSRFVVSPMPGLMVSIAVEPGDEVKTGQELAVLEAMKMENVLRAERDGVVSEIRVEPGAIVAADEVLMAFA
jgi:propionyl-CoA carboxylase alpha chain